MDDIAVLLYSTYCSSIAGLLPTNFGVVMGLLLAIAVKTVLLCFSQRAGGARVCAFNKFV